jgi:hypothetical protein
VTVARGQRSFYAVESIAGYPLFITVFTLIACNAIPDSSGRPIGIAAGVFVLFLVRSALCANYVALVGADGSVTFKALTRSTTTTLLAIHRLSARSGGRGGAMYFFYFTGGSASLNGLAGRRLGRYIISQNPSVSYPSNWFRRMWTDA